MTEKDREIERPANKARRRFLQSIFGLGGALESGAEASPVKEPPRRAKRSSKPTVLWCDLALGNIGFPSGLTVPYARPGSVMKLVTASCLLAEGAFNPNDSFECTGTISSDGQSFHCQKAHGRLQIEEAIGLSCNCFFVRAVKRLGPASIIEYGKRFALDRPVVGYKAGVYPDSDNLQTSPASSTAEFALGLSSELECGALQLLRLAALIAKEGRLPALRNAGMSGEADPVLDLSLPESTLRRLRTGMEICARRGTASAIDPDDKLQVACKTGTIPYGKQFESWVVGYFPRENPRHAFCVFSPTGTSREGAVPVANRFLSSVEWP